MRVSKKPNPVVERSQNDSEDYVNVTSTPLSDHAFLDIPIPLYFKYQAIYFCFRCIK